MEILWQRNMFTVDRKETCTVGGRLWHCPRTMWRACGRGLCSSDCSLFLLDSRGGAYTCCCLCFWEIDGKRSGGVAPCRYPVNIAVMVRFFSFLLGDPRWWEQQGKVKLRKLRFTYARSVVFTVWQRRLPALEGHAGVFLSVFVLI